MSATKISSPPRNPGIVPPWLTQPSTGASNGRNPGIVPPWLTGGTKTGSANAAVPTTFVRETMSISPDALIAAVRAAH